MGWTILLWLIVSIIAIPITLSNQEKEREKRKNEEEERKKKADEEKAEFDLFCQKNPEIRVLYKNANDEYNRCVRTAICIFPAIRPTTPTYTSGLYKGSLADNISTLSNAQKKQDYERAMARYDEQIKNNIRYKIDARKSAEKYYELSKIYLDGLKKIPNSDKWIERERTSVASLEEIIARMDKL